MLPRTGKPLRCFCSRQPILAFYGVNEDGELYVHQKVYKARRIFGESITTRGNILIRCRECLRWHNIELNYTNNSARLVETEEVPVTDEPTPDHV